MSERSTTWQIVALPVDNGDGAWKRDPLVAECRKQAAARLRKLRSQGPHGKKFAAAIIAISNEFTNDLLYGEPIGSA